jgi:peptidoglycan/LPS O-acetylase OafA/YrhL
VVRVGRRVRRRWDALAVFALYAASFGMWIVAPKPVQFYYHYFLPSCFLMAGAALALDELWRRKWRAYGAAGAGGACGLFAFFWPILTAAPLDDGQGVPALHLARQLALISRTAPDEAARQRVVPHRADDDPGERAG